VGKTFVGNVKIGSETNKWLGIERVVMSIAVGCDN
jgi:hypothetical protein